MLLFLLLYVIGVKKKERRGTNILMHNKTPTKLFSNLSLFTQGSFFFSPFYSHLDTTQVE
jgi:hypothetical protein